MIPSTDRRSCRRAQFALALTAVALVACDEKPAPVPQMTTASVSRPTRHGAPVREPTGAWQRSEPGLETAALSTPLLEAFATRIDPARLRLVNVTASLLGLEKRSTLQEMARRVPALTGVNGGFFDPEANVEGLRISDGRILALPVHRDWGVFYVAEGKPHLIHTREAASVAWPKVSFAVQCGPRLLAGGRAFELESSSHRRTLIGIDRSGKVLLVVTRNAMNLNDLARALPRSERKGGLDLVDALALDGGPSSGFIGPASERSSPRIVLPVGAPIADAIFVVRADAPMPYDDLTGLPSVADPFRGWNDVP